MPLISQLTRQTSNADDDLYLFEINGGAYRAITFANLKLSLISGTAGTGDMVYTGTTPVVTGSVPSFADTTGFNYDEGYGVGLAVDNLVQLLDVGGGTPGFGTIDGSNLINVQQPDISELVTGPISALAGSLPTYDGTTGKIINQGPEIGLAIGNVFTLEDVGSMPALPAVDASQLLNVPGVITSTPGSVTAGNIVSWGADNATLLDSGVSAAQVTTNVSDIAQNVIDIAANAFDIGINKTDITGKLDKSPNDGIAYMQQNGLIFVPDTADVDDSTDRRYVLDADLLAIANLPLDTAADIGLKQDKSPIDGILYGLFNGSIAAIDIASIPGLSAALAGKQDISPVDGITYGLLDGGIVALALGMGDVVGPVSSVDGEIALFDGITGKLLKTGAQFGLAIGNAILLEDVGGMPALPAVDGSQLINLPVQATETMQETYLASVQPLINTTALGGFRVREGLNNPNNFTFEGLNFSNDTTFSVRASGLVQGLSFNGVALDDGLTDDVFLDGEGSYSTLATNKQFVFNSATADANPGSGFIAYDSITVVLVNNLFISKTQKGGFVNVDDDIDELKIGDKIYLTQRSDLEHSQIFEVSGLLIDNATYFTIPVNVIDNGSGTPINNQDMDIDFNYAPNLRSTIDSELSSKILSGGDSSLDVPGVPVGESFSVAAGLAEIVQPDGTSLVVSFGPFNGVTVTEAGEVTFLFIDSGGLLVQRDVPTNTEFRTTALLGFVARDTVGQLTATAKFEKTAYQTWAQVADLLAFLSGAADANARIGSDASDTSFQRFEGRGLVFLTGSILGNINDPNFVTMPASSPTVFRVYLRDGTIESTVYSGLGTDTLLDPLVFDDFTNTPGDPLVTIPGSGNQAQIFRVFWQPAAVPPEIRIIHGQELFPNITAALNGLDEYFPLIPQVVGGGTIDLGGIIVRKSATDFTSQTDAVFFRRSQVAGGGGGSVAQDLQETYLLSLQPQLLINNTQGGVQFKDGTNNLFQSLIEALDFNDNTSFNVTGGGIETAIGLEPAKTGLSFMTGPIVEGTLATDVDIPSGQGYTVDSTSQYEALTPTFVSWSTSNAFTIPNLGVDEVTYIFVNSAGVISTQSSPLTETQLSANIFLGSTVNNNTASQVLFVINAPQVIGTTGNSLRGLNNFIGPLQQGGAVEQTDDTGANGLLAVKINSLNVFSPGINFHTSATVPDEIVYPETDPTTWAYMLQDGSISSVGNTLVDPTNFDDGGVLTTVPNPTRQATIQYVWKLVNGSVVITFGQIVYPDLSTAVQAVNIDRELRVLPSVLEGLATELAAICITKQSLDLADITNTLIIQSPEVGSGGGSGSGSTTFLGLTDTPNVVGDENTALTWDALGNLQNTGLTHSETATCWFLSGANVPGNGSLAIGGFTNNANSDTTGSTLVGQNSANNLGDSNDNINIFGQNNLNAVIPDDVMSNILVIGNSSLSALVAGSNVISMGPTVGGNLTSATNVTLMGVLSGSLMTSATDVHIYGRQFGPGGVVTDYVDFHDTLKMNILSNTVSIGGAANTVVGLTAYSLVLEAEDKILGLNRVNQTNEDLISLSSGDLWYNSTADQVRANLQRGVVDLSGLPTGFINWPNGLIRNSTTVLRVESPLSARDDTDTYDFRISSFLDASLLVDGAGGINTLQFPAKGNQFYNLRLIGDPTGVNADSVELIETGTSPALPSGYSVSLTLFPPALTTTGETWIQTGYSINGTSIRTYYYQSQSLSQVLLNGTATVRTSATLNKVTTGTLLVPSGFRILAHLNVGFKSGVSGNIGDSVDINGDETGTGGQNQRVAGSVLSDNFIRQNMDVVTSTSAAVQYIQSDLNALGTNRTNMYVSGFTMSMRYT